MKSPIPVGHFGDPQSMVHRFAPAPALALYFMLLWKRLYQQLYKTVNYSHLIGNILFLLVWDVQPSEFCSRQPVIPCMILVELIVNEMPVVAEVGMLMRQG